MAKGRKIHRVPVQTARWAIIAMVVLCVVISFGTWKETRQKEALMRENKKKIEARSKEIKATGAAIRNSDSMEFAEEVAREDLGMVKPREVIYVDKEKERVGETNEEDSR